MAKHNSFKNHKKYKIKQTEFKNKKLAEKYIDIITNIDTISKTRENILKSHFGELFICDMKEVQDIDTRIQEIVTKEPVHPSTFLTSSLGFNKMNWNKNVETILKPFGLKQKLEYPTLKNALRFEKLKLLILKYLEKEKLKNIN